MLYKLFFYIKEIRKLFFSLEVLCPKPSSSWDHCQSLHKSKHRSNSSFHSQHSQATPQTSAIVKMKIIVIIFQTFKNLFKFYSFLPNSLFLKNTVSEWKNAHAEFHMAASRHRHCKAPEKVHELEIFCLPSPQQHQ